MRHFLTLTITLILFGTINSFSQRSYGGIPLSFTNNEITTIDIVHIANPDINELIAQADINEKNGMLHEYGRSLYVDINMNNSGEWTELEDGRVWRLKIVSEKALALGVHYSNFFLPEGASLYL